MLFTKFELTNGLTVIHHPDFNTKLCVLNLLYKVGSRDEDPNKTGFAHLFEHLMFGGSEHISNYDEVLQNAGGDNNAFTSNDITNYYLSLPYNNIETGFWLESDRMLGLNFSQTSLDIQRNVVIEEFKERYLNQPYGDVWLKLLPLAYQKHPYSWPTIGKEIKHIEEANIEEVKSFFHNFYAPNNAVLVVAGKITIEETKALANKWFGDIPSRPVLRRTYEKEPIQKEPRRLEIEASVPQDLIAKAYHMPRRIDPNYYAIDLFSDILGGGRSSRFYQVLVKERGLFSELDCYITGDEDPGLFMVEGKLSKGISIEEADSAIQETIKYTLESLKEKEVQKVKNKTETNILFNDVGILNKAMKLAYAEFLGDINIALQEAQHYQSVTLNEIKEHGSFITNENNCSTLYYKAKNES